MALVTQDHYAVLELGRDADDAQVRTAYRRCALAAHPDKGGSAEAFQAVSAAFATLSNSQERAAYDARCLVSNARAASAKRKAVCPEQQRRACLERLERAVSTAPKESRRTLLAGFPPRVSKALLAWMQAKPATGLSSVEEPKEGLTSPAMVLVHGDSPNDTSEEHCDVGSQGVHRASAGSKGRGSQLYRASACCANLNLLSRSTSIEKAVEFHAVLVVVRRHASALILQGSALSCEELASHILRRLEAACDAMGVCSKDMGLTYRAVVSAIAVIGRQINGRATSDLSEALRQRERLLAARSSGWLALRDVWIRLLAETRSFENAEAYVDSVMRAFAPKRAQQDARQMRRLADSQWQPMSVEQVGTPQDLQQKSLAAAVRAVEKALDTLEKNRSTHMTSCKQAKALSRAVH